MADNDTPRAKPSEIREYFDVPGRGKPTLKEMQELKASPDAYTAIAEGIGNGTFTY